MQKSIDLVRQLVNDFKTHEAKYLASDYQEQEARKDFIDKFLIALGWDVNHEHQKNPYEQEVKIEQSVKTGKSQRRADYAFFIGPNFRDPKFFIEAKKPSRSLANPDDYYQIIRYAYNKKIPISVLTDFEEFHVIDCRFMPDMATALDRRIASFHYSEYANEEKFSLIYHLFGREAVAAGSIEKRAAELPKPKGKGAQVRYKGGFLPIDEAFLEKLDGMRLTLAKSFKKHNQELESEELTEAVQRTIDRLVFIRFLEDKNIEEPHIANLVQNSPFTKGGRAAGGLVWRSFVALCKSLEPKYNGLVFKHHALIDGDKFVPPEEEFAEICNELSDANSVYLFDEIPISILGSIYERFLGKVVHATPKRADVEDKPEVRKAGGVYYTPEYIVRYIVQNTVGKLIEGKTPEEISQMAFADIACGSGSFLIEVYSELLDYHTRYYSTHPEKAKPGDTQMREGKVVLSLKKRQEILTHNIYGVDIDYQATEVTQLSLYLKLLEDVTMNDAYQFGLLKEKILPDLKNNIKCGNSLIGTDILEGDLFEKTEERKLNPMNFADAFPNVRKRGGFDAIVGNPPYVRSQLIDTINKEYFTSYYEASSYQPDTFAFFLEKGIRLLRNKGHIGYIIPNGILTNTYYSKLRLFLLNKTLIQVIVDLKDGIFENASVDTSIFVLERTDKDVNSSDHQVKIGECSAKLLRFVETPQNAIEQKNFFSVPDYAFNTRMNLNSLSINAKIANVSKQFGDFVIVKAGMKVRKDFVAKERKNQKYKQFLFGADIKPYSSTWGGYWVCYDKSLETKFTNQAFRDETIFVTKEKILIRQVMGKERIYATFDRQQYYCDQTVYVVIPNKREYDTGYFLGIISSKLLDFYFGSTLADRKQTFPKIKGIQIEQLPIRTINFSDPTDKSRHDHIVKLVEQMLSAKEKLVSAKLESEKDRLELLCSSLDRQIDEAVYELYGLTAEEIKVVDGEE